MSNVLNPQEIFITCAVIIIQKANIQYRQKKQVTVNPYFRPSTSQQTSGPRNVILQQRLAEWLHWQKQRETDTCGKSMPRHWAPEQQVLIREPGVAGTEWGAVFQEHVWGEETSPRRPQTHRPTSVNAAHGVTLLSWRKWQNINSCFHHSPNPFSLIPGPSAQRDLGPQTKCLSLIHLSLLSSSLFFFT